MKLTTLIRRLARLPEDAYLFVVPMLLLTTLLGGITLVLVLHAMPAESSAGSAAGPTEPIETPTTSSVPPGA
jgi:hypothetical protein